MEFKMCIEETIFALSSGIGRAGISVIRISGPEASSALQGLTRAKLPKPKYAKRSSFINLQGEHIDDGLVIWFPAPNSYTGEDVVELQCHGGIAVVKALELALLDIPGLRPAQAGEFSRRAFENGKIDLTEAEGIVDLIEAETEAQRKQASRQSRGELGRLYDGWRDSLIQAQALSETEIDFSDEDVPGHLLTEAKAIAEQIYYEITNHLNDARRGERLRVGLYLVILGPPNAGKSSLLNLLAQRDAAIVSDRAGTTRDVIDVHLDLGGFPIVACDTAGLRDVGDELETEGVRRARERAEDADIKLVVFDANDLKTPLDIDPSILDLIDTSTLVVFNKNDLPHKNLPQIINNRPVISISVKTGEGLDTLLDALENLAGDFLTGGFGPSITRERHRGALTQCKSFLQNALEDTEAELLGENLRLASRTLGSITGRVDVEDLLDVIFSKFCIGK